MKQEKTNQTYSNRVLRAEFDDYWKTAVTKSGYVKYTALKNKASVDLILSGGSTRTVLSLRMGTCWSAAGEQVTSASRILRLLRKFYNGLFYRRGPHLNC